MTTKYPVANLLEPVLILAFLLVLNSCNTNTPLSENSQHKSGTVNEPVDVKVEFPSIKIGNQIWMTENLSVDTFRNGDPIESGVVDNKWTPRQSVYDNNSKHLKKYGRLYDMAAIHDPRGLAPEGWHVPNAEEWQELVDYLGGQDSAAFKLSADIEYLPNITPCGFNAFPGGQAFDSNDEYEGMGIITVFGVRLEKRIMHEFWDWRNLVNRGLSVVWWDIERMKVFFNTKTNFGEYQMMNVRLVKNDDIKASWQYNRNDTIETE